MQHHADDASPPPVEHAKLRCTCADCIAERRAEVDARRDEAAARLEEARVIVASLPLGSPERATALARLGGLAVGMTRTKSPPERQTWRDMIRRCEVQHDRWYPSYGGRGIRVCDAWHDFDAFYADMGPKPSEHHSLDRIDNDGDYEPANCRWATAREQQENKSNARRIEWNGKRLTVKQWARELGVNLGALKWRLGRGWSAEAALGRPYSPTPSPALDTNEQAEAIELLRGGMRKSDVARAMGVSPNVIGRLARRAMSSELAGKYSAFLERMSGPVKSRLGLPKPMPGTVAAINRRYGRRSA